MRKRVIKLLSGIFSTVADSAIQTDICCRMIGAMDDSDDGVKVSLCSTIHYLPLTGIEITPPIQTYDTLSAYPIHLSLPSSDLMASLPVVLAASAPPAIGISLTIQALATKSLAELLYPPTGSGQNTSLLVDIVSEYHGRSRSLENAIQKVS